MPIFELNTQGKLVANYNSERFSVSPSAPEFVKATYSKLSKMAEDSEFDGVNLQPSRLVVINNPLCLHCRDILQDNRRTLVRVFGYRKNADYVLINQDPLIVKG